MYRDKGGWRVAWRKPTRGSKWFISKPEAARFEAERALGIGSKLPSERQCPSFKDFAEVWLRTVCEVEKAESQWVKDREVVERHLAPALGHLKLSHLRKSHLLELKANLRQKKARGKDKVLAPKTVNLILALAKCIMAAAVDRELIAVNVWKSVKLFKLPNREFAYWQPGERDWFLKTAAHLDPEFVRLCAVACHTGLRLGELAALTRGSLDFERRSIRVRGSWSLQNRRVGPTKGKEVASIEMNSVAYEALAPYRFIFDREAYVFSRSLFWSARHRLGKLATKVGASPIRFHDLRHTFASCLAMAGVDLLAIQQYMRHKSYAMTLRYAHLHPSHLAGGLEVLTRKRLDQDGDAQKGVGLEGLEPPTKRL